MATNKKKIFGTYKGLIVEGRGRTISDKKLNKPLNIPATNDNELSIWMRLAKMLAEAKLAGAWGTEENEALKWVREISSADRNFLKGDCAVWTFYNEFQTEEKLAFQTGGKKGRTKLSKRQQEKTREKLNKGISITQIAKDHDVSRGTIYRFIKNQKQI